MKEFKAIRIKGYKKIPQGGKKDNNIIKISLAIIVLVILLIIFAIYLIIRKNSNEIEKVNEIKKIKEINPINQHIKNIIQINQTIDEDLKKKYESLTEKAQNFEKSLRKITKEEIEQFRNDNSLGILYDNTKYKRTEFPDITIVTPLYNQAHCIHKAIRSVQNQSLNIISYVSILYFSKYKKRL